MRGERRHGDQQQHRLPQRGQQQPEAPPCSSSFPSSCPSSQCVERKQRSLYQEQGGRKRDVQQAEGPDGPAQCAVVARPPRGLPAWWKHCYGSSHGEGAAQEQLALAHCGRVTGEGAQHGPAPTDRLQQPDPPHECRAGDDKLLARLVQAGRVKAGEQRGHVERGQAHVRREAVERDAAVAPPDVDHELVYERVEGVVHRLLLCTPATRWASRASFGIFGKAADLMGVTADD